jgi:8-oxo-dGTP pyrophosphatase MutT (NUDIX family)
VARPAATVVLRRGALVLLLERSMTMSFAPGMNVFPGGGVSEDDLASADPLLACAIRETKEEVDIAVPVCHLFDRWVTPEVEDQRFDVSFFVADTEEVGRLTTTEAVAMRWIDPAEALDTHRDGLLPMLRPTVLILEALASGRVDGQAAAPPVPKLPRRRLDGRWDVLHAETNDVLVSGVAGPDRAESDGSPMVSGS